MKQIIYTTQSFIELVAMGVEVWGVIIIVATVLKEIKKTVIDHKFNLNEVSLDQGMNHGLAAALEILLAAEILKTLIVRTPRQLLEVGALVVIRIFIAYILHWELKQKSLTHEVHEKGSREEK